MRKPVLRRVSGTGRAAGSEVPVSPHPPKLTFLTRCLVLGATIQVKRMWRSKGLGISPGSKSFPELERKMTGTGMSPLGARAAAAGLGGRAHSGSCLKMPNFSSDGRTPQHCHPPFHWKRSEEQGRKPGKPR